MVSSLAEMCLPVPVGTVVGGKYLVQEILGAGGMGVVVRAEQTLLHRSVALKFLLPGASGDARAVPRLLREARAAAALTSEHVARVLDVSADEALPYIVFEYLEGQDLKKVLGAGPLPIDQAVDFALQVCDALGEAHGRGIVHRDLKPNNLFLVERAGNAIIKVLDFGISKRIRGDEAASPNMTKSGELVGSPAYIAPEQFLGADSVDERVDVWGLGVCLYEFLTGRVPFTGSSMYEIGAQIAHEAPVAPRVRRPDLSEALERVVLRCLEKRPDDRFGSVGELAEALEAVRAGPNTYAAARATGATARASGVVLPQALGSAPVSPANGRSAFPATNGGTGASPVVSPAGGLEGATRSDWSRREAAPASRSAAFWIALTVLVVAAVGVAGAFLVWSRAQHRPVAASTAQASSEDGVSVARGVDSALHDAPVPSVATLAVAPPTATVSAAVPLPSAIAVLAPVPSPRPRSKPHRDAGPPASAPDPLPAIPDQR